MNDFLEIEGQIPFDAMGAGVVISRGAGRHVDRIASHFVLLFVRSGTLYINEAGTDYVVGEGESLILWPGRHHFGTRDYDEDLQFFWLHFTLNSKPENGFNLKLPQYTRPARPDFITELFRRYLDDQGSGTIQPLGAALYTWMIMQEVAAADRPAPEKRARAALAGRVDTYIRTHHHERISVSDVAKAVGYNSQYLCRIYRETYNSSLAGAIRRMRISHAKWLLLETDSSIGEVARFTGFDDASYFQRVFKQLEGITPTQFRRLHARMNVTYR